MNNDLISRSALYRQVKTECNPYGKPTIDFESGKKVLKLIDNAPTVGPTCMVDKSSFSNEQYKADIDNAYACGYEKGKKRKTKRRVDSKRRYGSS